METHKNVGKHPLRSLETISKPVAKYQVTQWKPTGRHFSLFEKYPLTRIMEPTDMPIELPPSASSSPQITMVSRFTDHKLSDRQAGSKGISVQIVLWYLDSGCSRHMTGDRARLINFVEKFIGTVRFGNDEYAAIVGYGDYKLALLLHSQLRYGGSPQRFTDYQPVLHLTEIYDVSFTQFAATKASFKQSHGYRHRRGIVIHLNFGTLNELARNNLVRGLPMLKYDKDHLCPSCQLGKSKKASHPLKAENTNTEVLHTLHMDLCGPMRTESINGKKYVLVIVDDYTRFGWVRFLRTKDETPQVIEKFIVKTQRALNATVRFVRTDNGTEFVNKTLRRIPNGSPSTTLSQKALTFFYLSSTESLLPHPIPLLDTSDSDVETLFDHVDKNILIIPSQMDFQNKLVNMRRLEEQLLVSGRKISSGSSAAVNQDADYAGCHDTRRSTSGSAQFLGHRIVSWSSKKQKSTAISTTEAKYIALLGCCAQIL
ncbi:retrovirus-related pol polyprotein from transposon TNT 1-94 [Tanacetum coccineum]|uniref:Retrovirus-related pol polyprotein from transposon TNT 1-94 n=1 Tax=Tanacetum coccineum TaxID=301880 RepID=A0ABQ4X813_9ASTR